MKTRKQKAWDLVAEMLKSGDIEYKDSGVEMADKIRSLKAKKKRANNYCNNGGINA